MSIHETYIPWPQHRLTVFRVPLVLIHLDVITVDRSGRPLFLRVCFKSMISLEQPNVPEMIGMDAVPAVRAPEGLRQTLGRRLTHWGSAVEETY